MRLIFVLLLLRAFQVLAADALTEGATTFRVKTVSPETIKGLSLISEGVFTATLLTGPTITLRGRLDRPERAKSNLMLEGNAYVSISPDSSGEFSITVLVREAVSVMKMKLIDALGNVENQLIEISISQPQWEQITKKVPSGRHQLSPSLGVTVSSYSQSNGRALDQTLLTFKTSYKYAAFPPHWDLGMSLYFSLFPIQSSVSNTWARYFGLNGRVGYSFPLSSRWTMGVMTGIYYTTMFTSRGSKIGFENLMGPQLYPTVKYQLNSQHSFSSYIKVSAVGSTFSLSELSNREEAFGISWHRLSETGRLLSVSADYSNLQVYISPLQITSRSLSLGAGFGF